MQDPGEDKEQTTQEETHQNLKKQDVTVGQNSNEQHSIQEKDSGEETSKQDDGRTSMASESSSHTQNTDIISEEDSKSQKQTMDFKKGIRQMQTEK